MPGSFRGQPIRKETVSLGIGGQIHRDDDFPTLPNRARVKFSAEADFSSVKHKFLDGGGVEEIVILTIDAKSFDVIEVTEKVEEPELPLDGEPEPANA
jgi:hypothetical protein